MTESEGPPTDGWRPPPRPGPRRRPRPRYDPPPRSFGDLLQRLWIVGLLAVIAVVVLVLVTGPGDISILRRLFIWFSTFVFSVWLLREHRRRLPARQRQVIFVVCSGALIVLFLILTITAF